MPFEAEIRSVCLLRALL